MAKKMALGRGLGALIEDNKTFEPERDFHPTSTMNEIDIAGIESNPFQPRTTFDDTALEELAASIKELGVIQPITVRKIAEDRFQIISGERRCKAAKLAGLTRIPAFVREANDQEMLEMALVENIQREDLNPIEIAISYQRLIEECRLTQEEMSSRVGKNRATISNYLRLLKLPAEIQIGLRDRRISFGHARTLINIEDPRTQTKIYFQIINEDLSVRKVEAIVREINNPPAESTIAKSKPSSEQELGGDFREFRQRFSEKINAKVDVKRDEKGRGKIIIPFDSDDDFFRIKQVLF